MRRLWFCVALVALTSVTVAGCASDSGRGKQGHSAEAAGLAPGCGPGFDLTPTGGRYNESATLADVAAGQAVSLTVTTRVQRATMIRQLQLVVGKPGTRPGAGDMREAPSDSMRLAANQVAVVDLYSGPAQDGQEFTATVTLTDPGRYPVEALATSVSPGMCGGIMVHDDDNMQSARPIGFIAVH